jgi:hypothetical protein
MSTETKVREAWAAFVEEAKAATHLNVLPGMTIYAPVRINQLSPSPVEHPPAPEVSTEETSEKPNEPDFEWPFKRNEEDEAE